jgi:hypothetical protein
MLGCLLANPFGVECFLQCQIIRARIPSRRRDRRLRRLPSLCRRIRRPSAVKIDNYYRAVGGGNRNRSAGSTRTAQAASL